jgi:iron(III) transport system permease protein
MPASQTSTFNPVGHTGWSALRLKDPTLPVWIGAALLLVFLMLLPLGAIFRSSVWDDTGFTLSKYVEVFTNKQFLKAIWNTLIISAWVGILSVAIGALLAWLVARTDLPWKKPIRALVMASFVTPPFLGAFAWTLLAGPNAGALNKLYRAVTGSEDALFNIFTMPGLIFVMAFYSFPYVFSMIANVFELISSDLEDAAEILGAGKWQTAWTVTLPLALPALIGGFILAFLHSLSLFGAPAILGLPAGLHTITTQIWTLFQYPPRLDLAAAFSVPLLLATMLLIAVQKKLLGRKGFSTVGGKGAQKRLIRLGWARAPVLLFVLGILSLSVFLPYWILLKAALSQAWAMPLTWDNFTLHNFYFAFFEYGDTQRAIYNTFKLGIVTATLGTLLATLIAYITNRNLFRGARYLSFFALAPLVIPGIVLAVGLFIVYTRPPLILYGTIWILFVAFLTKEMPIGFSQAESTFKSIHPELEDASRIIGANRLISLKDVTAPLARSGLIAAWSFIFIGVIRELSAAILLFAPSSKVVSVVIFDLKEEGQVGVIAVLGILLLVVSFAVILAVQWLGGRDVVATREWSYGNGLAARIDQTIYRIGCGG